MPRQSKGPRLHKFKHRNEWYIRDTGRPDRSTGEQELEQAEKALAEYIRRKEKQCIALEPSEVSCGEILMIYAEEHAPTLANPERQAFAIEALLPFWGELRVSNITEPVCKKYWRERKVKPGTTRRELGVLQAAVNYCKKAGNITHAPIVTLPEKPPSTQRWLTRQEAARLLWAAYRGHKSTHLAKFILIALYTGTRKSAVLSMGFHQNIIGGWFDLENGVMYRASADEAQTNKRKTPARIPRQLSAHLKRWKAAGCVWAVEYQGGVVLDVKRGFNAAVKRAGLKGVTPHTLKHTAITWALQNGSDLWDAAGFFSTSPETIQRVYGHHSPHHQESAVKAMENPKK